MQVKPVNSFQDIISLYRRGVKEVVITRPQMNNLKESLGFVSVCGDIKQVLGVKIIIKEICEAGKERRCD